MYFLGIAGILSYPDAYFVFNKIALCFLVTPTNKKMVFIIQ